MTTANAQAGTPFPATLNDFVSDDFLALASHMSECRHSRGRFFGLRAALEALYAFAGPRIVTTAALFAGAGLCLLSFA